MSTEEARKLFVAGLPDSITEDILRQLFEATGGTVVEVSLPKDRATGRPRGFGFVTLSSSAEAQVARESLDGSMQAGKSISVRPFQAEPPKRDGVGGLPGGPRSERMGGPAAADRTIYVGNLPYDATQAEVEGLFSTSNAGPVVRVSLPTDEEGRKRGFGFVTMASAEVANSAIDALRGADLRGRSLIVNLARPKGEGGGGGYSGGPSSTPYGGGGGGGGGFGGPPSGFRSGPSPEVGGGGGPPASRGRKQYDKRRNAEGEGPRKKAWDRERGGGGRVDPSDYSDD